MTAGKPLKTQVLINGTDVSSAVVNWRIISVGKPLQTARITLSKAAYDLEPLLQTAPNRLSSVIKRGVLVGSESIEIQGEVLTSNLVGNVIIVDMADGVNDLIEANITKTFSSNIDTEAGVISEILKTVVNDFTDQTADNTSVQASGSVITLARFICNNADVLERCQLLADFLSWQIYQNPTTALIHFEPQGFPSLSDTLEVGTNIPTRPIWIKDSRRKIKNLKVFGGPTETPLTESFNGDTVETEFTLSQTVVTVNSVTVGGVEQIGGVEGQADATVDYFIDVVDKKLKFVSAPGSGTNNVVINYTYLSPITLQSSNTITKGRSITDRRPELITVSDVENFMTAKLARFFDDILSTTLRVTNVTGAVVGQSVRVVDINESIDKNFIITKLTKQFPYRWDEIMVDDAPQEIEGWETSMEDRVTRIEEKLIQDETIVIILKQSSRDVISIGRRYNKMSKQDVSGNVGIYSNPALAIYGTSVYGLTSGLPDPVLRFMQQGADFFLETFEDTDFKASQTTSTWGSTGSTTFTAGQVAQSEPIDFRHGTITKAVLTSTETSGTFLYEMSANSIYPLSHWKMNDNAASTVVLDSIGSNNGTLVGGDNTADISAAGKINEALVLDGTADYISANNSGIVGPWTVSCWIKTTNTAGQFYIERGDGVASTSGGFRFGMSSAGKPSVTTFGVKDYAAADTAVNDDAFHHVVAVFDSSFNVAYYLDSIADGTDTHTANMTISAASGLIGANYPAGGYPTPSVDLAGTIDDVRIYNQALTQSQISSIYNAGAGTEEDNAGWETVTSGNSHLFTNSGTDLRFRITENAASTGEISQITVSGYH